MVTILSVDINVTANAKQAQNELKNVRYQMQTLRMASTSFIKTLSLAVDTFKTLGKIGAMAFAGVTLAVLGSIGVVKDYNANLIKAAAIAGLTKTEMYSLGDMINEVSLVYAQSSTNISEGVVELT